MAGRGRRLRTLALDPVRLGLWDEVVERDARWIWATSDPMTGYERWRSRQTIICVAPHLAPTRYLCAGRQTVDHVKDAPRMARKAPDDPQHLVAMCEAHNVWYPPTRALRQAEREYLRGAYGPAPDRTAV